MDFLNNEKQTLQNSPNINNGQNQIIILFRPPEEQTFAVGKMEGETSFQLLFL